MQKKQIEKWVWILIYGGLLGISLGWFLGSTLAAAWVLMVGGGAVAAAGVVLIFVRSRMGP